MALKKISVVYYLLLLRQAEQGLVGSTYTISLGECRWLDRIEKRAGLAGFAV